jgi:acyl-CoA synthetase (NDP forming)
MFGYVNVTGDLKSFFEPESVVVIGASRTPGKAGYEIMSNLRANGYVGRIYPVNPNADGIMGYKVYASVRDLPEIPDVAIILVPALATVEALEGCAEKGIKAVVVESGGFAEVDEHGAALQDRITEIARNNHMRIIGPNTSGVISTPANFITTFFPLGKIRRGSIAYLAQTGNFATHTMRWILSSENFGVSRVIGLGNKCDVDDSEALQFLGDDPETKVICMYLEDFKNGRRFIEVARGVSKKKPIIALKGGATTGGATAAVSHTASMTANDSMIDGIFKQAGVVRIHKYSELIDTAKALAFQPLPRGRRVAILAPSGAMGVLAADACEERGLKVASFSESTLLKLREISPTWIRVGNPIDIWAAVQTQGMERGYRLGMEAALNDDNVDAVISIMLLIRESAPPSLDFVLETHRQNPGKPILISVTGDRELFDRAKTFLENNSIPVYRPVDEACEALATMHECARFASR